MPHLIQLFSGMHGCYLNRILWQGNSVRHSYPRTLEQYFNACASHLIGVTTA